MELNQEQLTQARIDIAAMEKQIEAQGREIGELKEAVQRLAVTVAQVRDTLTEARGGWKLMMLLGGGAATLGGIITWLATHMTSKGAP